MANPQTEDGYSPIANELLEALYHAKLTGGELRVILCVIRASYGWSQPVAPISISEVARRIGRVRPYIQQTVSTLMARGILARNGEGLYLVKDYELWRDDTNTPCNTELTCNPRVIPPVAPVLHLPITPLLQDMQPNPSPVKALRAPKSISKSSTKTNICDAPSASPTVRQSGTTRRIPKLRKTHPETDTILKEFGSLYEKNRGTPYLATFARDKKIIHDLLTASSVEEVRARMSFFLRNGSKWARDTCRYDVPMFRSAWNEIGVLKASERHYPPM